MVVVVVVEEEVGQQELEWEVVGFLEVRLLLFGRLFRLQMKFHPFLLEDPLRDGVLRGVSESVGDDCECQILRSARDTNKHLFVSD